MGYAIILSGGVGTRLGLDIPKQYVKVKDKTVLQYVVEKIEACTLIQGYVIVAAEEWQDDILSMMNLGEKFLGFAASGGNRQLSIYRGLLELKKVAKDHDLVLVQDAARPNTSDDLILRCMQLDDSVDGAMPVLPMKDTVYYSKDGKAVGSLLERNCVYAGQAPEAFRLGKYYAANLSLLPEKILSIHGSTEPAIMAGLDIAMISGDEGNFKITTPEDLERFREIVSRDTGVLDSEG